MLNKDILYDELTVAEHLDLIASVILKEWLIHSFNYF